MLRERKGTRYRGFSTSGTASFPALYSYKERGGRSLSFTSSISTDDNLPKPKVSEAGLGILPLLTTTPTLTLMPQGKHEVIPLTKSRVIADLPSTEIPVVSTDVLPVVKDLATVDMATLSPPKYASEVKESKTTGFPNGVDILFSETKTSLPLSRRSSISSTAAKSDSLSEEEMKDEGDDSSTTESSNSDSYPAIEQGLVGLANIGNTCFLNSAVQCLSNIPMLTEYFLADKHVTELNKTTSGAKGKLAMSFGSLIKKLWTSRSFSSVKPTALKKNIGNLAPQFKGYSQQDAQELLLFLLDGLHEDLNRVKEKVPYVEMKDIEGESRQDHAARFWDYFCERNDSHIKDTFAGQLCTEIVCQVCSNKSRAFQPFMNLSVPIPSGNNDGNLDAGKNAEGLVTDPRVQDCLKKFTQLETIQSLYCSKCKDHTEAKIAMSIHRLPPVLVIHLKRFDRHKKLQSGVSISKELRMDEYCSHDFTTNKCYKLVGVVNHMGSIYGGHYTADCFNAKTQHWVNYNDSHVKKISEDAISGSNAYVLLYTRTEMSSL